MEPELDILGANQPCVLGEKFLELFIEPVLGITPGE
jgi:hypothetical protein